MVVDGACGFKPASHITVRLVPSTAVHPTLHAFNLHREAMAASSFLKRPLLLASFLWNGPICGSPRSATFIRLPSEDIVEELTKIEDGAGAETIHGKPLTQAQLARLLAP
jgi:hypothetical protein